MKKTINVQLDLDLINNAGTGSHIVTQKDESSGSSYGGLSSREDTFMSFTLVNDFELEPNHDSPKHKDRQKTEGSKRQKKAAQKGGKEPRKLNKEGLTPIRSSHSVFRTNSMQHEENSLSMKLYGPMIKPEGKPYPITTMSKNQKTFEFGPNLLAEQSATFNHPERKEEFKNLVSTTTTSVSNKQARSGPPDQIKQQKLTSAEQIKTQKELSTQLSLIHAEKLSKTLKKITSEGEHAESFQNPKHPTPLKGGQTQSARENILQRITPKNKFSASIKRFVQTKLQTMNENQRHGANGQNIREINGLQKGSNQNSIFVSMDSVEGASKKQKRKVFTKDGIPLASSFFTKSSQKSNHGEAKYESGVNSNHKISQIAKKTPAHTSSVQEHLNQTKEIIASQNAKEKQPVGRKKSQKRQSSQKHDKKPADISKFFHQLALKSSVAGPPSSTKSQTKVPGLGVAGNFKIHLNENFMRTENPNTLRSSAGYSYNATTPHKEPLTLQDFLKGKVNSDVKKTPGTAEKHKKRSKTKINPKDKREHPHIVQSRESIKIATPKKSPQVLGMGSSSKFF